MPKKAAALSQELTRDNWPIRRRWMRAVLIWSIANCQFIIFAAIFGYISPENAILLQTLLGLLALIAAIMGSYVFGSAWDDKNKRRFLADIDEGDGGYPAPEPFTPPPTPFNPNETGPN